MISFSVQSKGSGLFISFKYQSYLPGVCSFSAQNIRLAYVFLSEKESLLADFRKNLIN